MLDLKILLILLRREWLLESRQKHAIGGILLYILSTVFICYLSFEKLEDNSAWNALLWVILLFITTNSTNNSFGNEGGKNELYLYTVLKPQALIASKMIYHSALNLLLCLLAFAVYALLLGNLIENILLFFTTIAFGSSGLSFVLTMNAAIVSKSGGNSSMIAILSFPLVLPLLLSVIKLSRMAAYGATFTEGGALMLTLIVLNILIAAMVYLLFPYLWRE